MNKMMLLSLNIQEEETTVEVLKALLWWNELQCVGRTNLFSSLFY